MIKYRMPLILVYSAFLHYSKKLRVSFPIKANVLYCSFWDVFSVSRKLAVI